MELMQNVLYVQVNVHNVQMQPHVQFVIHQENLEVNQLVHVQMANMKKKVNVMIVI